ncbi:MAG: 50S ribosomal protein L16 [Candidatus Hodarchaeota archaeon]
MGRRPWSCYRTHIDRKPYVKKRGPRGKEFVHGGADPKIRIYDMGDIKRNVGKEPEDFDICIGVQILHTVLCSDGTLESARTSINRILRKYLGRAGFHLRIRPHPYRVYRENKMMAFAGADRLQSGMRGSFGKPIGRMALLKAGQILVEAHTNMKSLKIIRKALKTSCYKFPAACRLVILGSKTDEYAQKAGLPRPEQP